MYLSQYQRFDFSIFKGRYFEIEIPVYDGDDVPVTLSTATVTCIIREELGQEYAIVSTFSCTVSNNNSIKMILDDTLSATISQSYGWYDLKVELEASKPDTFLYGQITFIGTTS